jgi:CBS domain-containing protein
MFQVYGQQGRVFSGTLDQLRLLPPVAAAGRVRRVAPVASEAEPASQGNAAINGPAQEALAAYGALDHKHARQPLTRVADVMHRPAHTVKADTSLGEAWQTLAQQGIGQAPVIDDGGTLVGLVGRADLLPSPLLGGLAADQAAWRAALAQPVSRVMWSPVPCAAPDTELRQVAALLLGSGLPGVPVSDEAGRVLGFVSRTDLLRALATDPPLDLWG